MVFNRDEANMLKNSVDNTSDIKISALRFNAGTWVRVTVNPT